MKHKTAKANARTRLLSLLLAVLMMLFCFPVTALGTDGIEGPISETLEETADAGLSAFERGVGELSPEALESMTLNAADVPEVISAQAIAEKDHVLRLREQEENLNTVVFQNRDGGKTVYLYANPVKYVDANGNVKDKSTTLKAENITLNGKTYSHSATENVFGQYYPTMPQNGVLITFGQYTVEMTPVITGILTLRDTAVANNKVTYNKVFGNGTSLVYTPTLSGVKEDIILQTYTGKSSFSFTLKTNGLAIVQTESDTFLADFEGNKVASLGKVIITDRANHTAYGSMTVAAKTEREEYTVTINAPTAFLTSATTVYPVTVDPTVNITEYYFYDGEYSEKIIQDICIFSGDDNPGAPISRIGNIGVGEEGEVDTVSRMLYRISSNYYYNMGLDYYTNNARFDTATLHAKMNVVETGLYLDVFPYTDNWSIGNELTSNYIGLNEYNSAYCSSTYVDNLIVDTVNIDLTNIFDYWSKTSNNFIDNGFILKVRDEGGYDDSLYNQIRVYQTEESNDTYISINYHSNNVTSGIGSRGLFRIFNDYSCMNLDVSANNTLIQSVSNFCKGTQWFEIKYAGNGYYEIVSAIYPELYLVYESMTVYLSNNNLDDCRLWSIEQVNNMHYKIIPKGIYTETLQIENDSTNNNMNVIVSEGNTSNVWSITEYTYYSWSYDDYYNGSYVPKRGFTVVSYNMDITDHDWRVSVFFKYDSNNIQSISGYKASDIFPGLDVSITRETGYSDTDDFAASHSTLYKNGNIVYSGDKDQGYLCKIDIENNQGLFCDETDVVIFDTISANDIFCFDCFWTDVRSNEQGDEGQFEIRFEVAKLGYLAPSGHPDHNDYNTYLMAEASQCIIGYDKYYTSDKIGR